MSSVPGTGWWERNHHQLKQREIALMVALHHIL